MRYGAVFLDMGFTLVKFQPSFEGIYGRACREEGFQVADTDLVEAIQAVWRGLVDQNLLRPGEVSEAAAQEWQQMITERILSHVGVPEREVEIITSRIGELFMDPASYRVYDEVPKVLAELKSAGLRLGIVSNWDWHLPRLCRELGVDRHLHFIVTSARVGRAALTMDSSIWVAVITGFPARLHFRIISFCTRGTCSRGMSTPRSPRATMMASLSERISSKVRTA